MTALSLHDRDVVQPENPSLPPGIRFPHEVLGHPDLNSDEKRRILSAWASDASAVPSFPTLRQLAGTQFPVTFSSIMDARERLDREAPPEIAFARTGQRGGSDVSPR
ncbi:MAG: hypothetical protein JO294_03095 [Alphaproteobacteria bacterium]|nr:hypothetical protein [Alphaproteobacteria bacterium]MBV9904554.1 hypothetical protein [Alphaproteobacteria bacterium]